METSSLTVLMVRRFQTRLAVSVSLVIALTVAGMTFLIMLFAANNIVRQHHEKGILLHQLLQKNIEYVAGLPSGPRDRGSRPLPSGGPPSGAGPVWRSPSSGAGETNEMARRIERFGVGRRRDLEVVLPGQRSMPRRSDLLVQGIADCFLVDTDIERILVVQEDGRIVATAGLEGNAPARPDADTASLCQKFLEQTERAPQIEVFGAHVGVITPLKDPDIEEPRALYVQFRKASTLELLGHRLVYVVLLGVGMIVLGIGLSIRLSRKMSQPVHALADSVREFGRGNLDHRVRLKTDDEFQTLGQALNQMACSIQAYTKKLEDETKRRESLESELRIAAVLQRSLLPSRPPTVRGLQLAGWSQAAAQVGGDFFDFLDLGSGRLGVMIGDATGKGLPAALLSSECWSVLTAFAPDVQSPADLLHKTNNALCKRLGDSSQFVTLFLMFIDVANRQLRYSVAGHNPPMLVRAGPGGEQRLGSRKGFPLGLFRDCRFEDVHVELNPSDTILLYSDGLTDAPGQDNRRFGEDRLRAALGAAARLPLSDLIASIRGELEIHLGSAEMKDDVTLVGVRFGSAPA